MHQELSTSKAGRTDQTAEGIADSFILIDHDYKWLMRDIVIVWRSRHRSPVACAILQPLYISVLHDGDSQLFRRSGLLAILRNCGAVTVWACTTARIALDPVTVARYSPHPQQEL